MELPDYIKNRYWKDYLPAGVTLEIDIPEDISMRDIFKKYTKDYSDKTFIIYDNKEYTYKDIQKLTIRFASVLLNLGVKKGDVIALWLSNCPQFIISYFATMIIGGTITAISPLYVAREMAYQVKDSGAKYLIMIDSYMPQYKSYETDLSLEKVILVNIEGGTPIEPEKDRIIYFNSLMEENPELSTFYEVKINPKEDIAVIQYTGGTTGFPKGASLSHYNIIANSLQLKQVSIYIKEKFLKEDIVSIFVLPWYHIFGQVVEMVSALLIGSKAFVLSGFDIEKVLEILKKHKPNSLFGVPTIYITLLNLPTSSGGDISCLKSTHVGATPMPIEAAKEWERKTGFAMGEGYGLSEASPAV
ncbi:hypothetical protein LCGC14_2217900, partial [marine sediment metagenome]